MLSDGLHPAYGVCSRRGVGGISRNSIKSAEIVTERVTLITGASAGIGTELARVFASNGHRVVLVARRADRLSTLANEIVACGGARRAPRGSPVYLGK